MGAQLADILGASTPLSIAPNQSLSRHPSRGTLIGLDSWHAKISSVNQDLSCNSPYRRKECYIIGDLDSQFSVKKY